MSSATLIKSDKKGKARKHKPTKRKQALDIDITDLTLQGNQIKAEVAGAITAADIDLSAKQASTLSLTIRDQERKLLDSDILKHRIDVEIDDKVFETAGIGKQGDDFPLVFEDKAVALLRRHKSYKKAIRGHVTRAEFAKSLVDEEPSIIFFCPELHKRQPIAKADDNHSQDKKDAERRPGLIGTTKAISVKGSLATSDQLEILQRMLETGTSKNASYKVLVSAVMTATQESDVHNDVGHNGVDVGIFNQNAHMGWPASRDIERDSAAYFDAAIPIDKKFPNIDEADLAQAVQKSGAGAGYYAQWLREAKRTVNVFLTGKLTRSSGKAVTVTEPFEFTRGQPGQPEDSWTCLQRLAEEVDWYCFAVDMVVYFVSGDYLRAARPMMSISEDTEGVDSIDWQVDNGIKVSEATIACQAHRWFAPPGATVELFDCGVANGRWVVIEITGSLYDNARSIKLERPMEPLPEPAPTTRDQTLPGSGDSVPIVPGGNAKINADGTASAPADAPEEVRKAIAAGNRIIDKPYIWGGGHGSSFNDRGYDCSGAVSFVTHALGSERMWTSGELEVYGEEGEGQWITIYANEVHTFIEVAGIFLNTVHDSTTVNPNGGSGPRWRGSRQTTSSGGPFIKRHPPGL